MFPRRRSFPLLRRMLCCSTRGKLSAESNHPPITIKNIPAGINKRLSSLSSDKASFDQAAPPYQKALDESGYHYTLQYEPAKTNKRKNRQRNNILWYNPPFSKNTSTNIGHKFLALVDKHFPKDHKLRKIFNRNSIKISYSCMTNTKQIIDNHNKRILTASIQVDDTAAAATINNELKIRRRQTSGTASGSEVTARITSGCRCCEVSRRSGLVCDVKEAILPSRLKRE